MERITHTLDRDLIGRLVDRQIPRIRTIGTIQGLAEASKVSRSTVNRILKDRDETVTSRTYARIEAALGLPADTLITAGAHDVQGLDELGVPAELVAWVAKEIVKKQGGAGAGVRAAT